MILYTIGVLSGLVTGALIVVALILIDGKEAKEDELD